MASMNGRLRRLEGQLEEAKLREEERAVRVRRTITRRILAEHARLEANGERSL